MNFLEWLFSPLHFHRHEWDPWSQPFSRWMCIYQSRKCKTCGKIEERKIAQ
jgi:hypothetical protein